MSTPAIQSTLQQMQIMAAQAAGSKAVQPAAVNAALAGGFAGELQSAVHRINRLQQTASAQAEAFQSGDPRVALNDVMVDMQKASVAFQMGMQVRNRLIGAYKEVMNMQV